MCIRVQTDEESTLLGEFQFLLGKTIEETLKPCKCLHAQLFSSNTDTEICTAIAFSLITQSFSQKLITVNKVWQ